MALNVNNVDVNFFRVKPEFCLHSLANGNTAIRWRTGSLKTAADGGSGLYRTV